MNEGTTILEHLNFFNKVISELLTVDVKLDEEDKAFILLSSLSESYDHIITIKLYGKETLILEEVASTFLSNEIKKRSNQDKQTRSGLDTRRKGRREERSGLLKGVLLLSQRMSLKKWLQVSTRVVEEEGANCVGRHNIKRFRRNWSINSFLQK